MQPSWPSLSTASEGLVVAMGNRTAVLTPGRRLIRPLPEVRTKMAPCLGPTSLPGRVKDVGPRLTGESKPPPTDTTPAECGGDCKAVVKGLVGCQYNNTSVCRPSQNTPQIPYTTADCLQGFCRIFATALYVLLYKPWMYPCLLFCMMVVY